MCVFAWQRSGWKLAGIVSLIAAAVIVLPSLALLGIYGHLVSQSILAKSRGINGGVWDAAKELLFPDPLCVVTFPLALLGIWQSRKRGDPLRLFSVWFVAYLAAYLIVRPHVWSWYAEPVHYLHFMFAAIGLAFLYEHFPAIHKKCTLLRFSAAGGMIIVSIWIILLLRNNAYSVTRYVYGGIER